MCRVKHVSTPCADFGTGFENINLWPCQTLVQFRCCTLGGFVTCRYPESIHILVMWLKQQETIHLGMSRVPPIYGDLRDGLLLFYPHDWNSWVWRDPPIAWDVDVPWLRQLRWGRARRWWEMMIRSMWAFVLKGSAGLNWWNGGRAGDALERTTLPSISILLIILITT